jgi:hypothetical protein
MYAYQGMCGNEGVRKEWRHVRIMSGVYGAISAWEQALPVSVLYAAKIAASLER